MSRRPPHHRNRSRTPRLLAVLLLIALALVAWMVFRGGDDAVDVTLPSGTQEGEAPAPRTRAVSALPSGKFATAATATSAGSSRRAKAASRGHTHTAAVRPNGPVARRHSRAMSASVSPSFRLVRSRQARARRALAAGSLSTVGGKLDSGVMSRGLEALIAEPG